MAEGVRPEDYCDEPVEDEFGEIIKCRSGRNIEAVLCVRVRACVFGELLVRNHGARLCHGCALATAEK